MYAGMNRIYCPAAALNRGCDGVTRALASLDRLQLSGDRQCAAVLMACRGCADPLQCEVDGAGTVCLVPLHGDGGLVVSQDLDTLQGEA